MIHLLHDCKVTFLFLQKIMLGFENIQYLVENTNSIRENINIQKKVVFFDKN